MANILFVMRYPLHKNENLKSKFDGQIAAAKALGHQAYWIGWDAKALWLMGGDSPERLVSAGMTAMPAYEHTLFYAKLMKALRVACERHPIDLVYLRYMRFFGNAVKAIRTAKERGAKLIVEHPTYPFEVGKVDSLLRKPVFWYCDRVFERIEPMIDLYTLIGPDSGGTLHGRPAMNILNGVDVARLPLHKPRKDAKDVSMLALASMSFWQGYDRLIKALAEYQGEPEVTLHLVGSDGDGSMAAWRKLSESLGLQDKVFFHPPTYGEALDRLINDCDIGVGQLGLYRKRQHINIPLKLREYMARGLPFVYTPVAPSIPDEPRYSMSIPNDDSPIDLRPIVDFALRARADESAPLEMRRYAEKHMSWSGILAPVFESVGIV